MTAAIDLGNTRIKIGIFSNNVLQETIRTSKLEDAKNILKNNYVTKAIFSSVSLSDAEISSEFNFVSNKIIFNALTALPIKNTYLTPDTLGYDRLAAAVGANELFPNENVLILDLGTAIKYDFVNSKNEFVGGLISLGKQMRFKALNTFTQKLPLLDAEKIPDLIGNSTNTCIESGVMNGILAEINGVLAQYIELHQVKIIICGGDAPYFESRIKYPTFAAPNLVLQGLNRILNYNVNKI